MSERERVSVLSPSERRLRSRQAMITAILDAALDSMGEVGVAGLSLHEVGRRVGLRAQSLYKYFPSKSALYDALYCQGARQLLEHDRRVWSSTPPNWDRIRRWLEGRLAFAREQGPLYELTIGTPVPDFAPSVDAMREAAVIGEEGTRALAELVDSGAMSPQVAPRQAMNMLLAASRGIVAETLGKQHLVTDSERFRDLIPQFVEAFRALWSAEQA